MEEKLKITQLDDNKEQGNENNTEEDALEAISMFNDNMNSLAMNAF
jgi:hypothetical protein